MRVLISLIVLIKRKTGAIVLAAVVWNPLGRKEKILYICYIAWAVDLLLVVHRMRVLAARMMSIANSELKWLLQILAQFKMPCPHFAGSKEEHQGRPQDRRCLGPESN
jgi:hypothetical protein